MVVAAVFEAGLDDSPFCNPLGGLEVGVLDSLGVAFEDGTLDSGLEVGVSDPLDAPFEDVNFDAGLELATLDVAFEEGFVEPVCLELNGGFDVCDPGLAFDALDTFEEGFEELLPLELPLFEPVCFVLNGGFDVCDPGLAFDACDPGLLFDACEEAFEELLPLELPLFEPTTFDPAFEP